MMKVFFNPKRYIWFYDKHFSQQQKRFIEEYKNHKHEYCKEILDDFVEYINECIIPNYEDRV